jgi:hypothetical protein
MTSPQNNFAIGNVPCNGCMRCCRGDAVRLLPDDNADSYHTEPHCYLPGALMLAHKSNKDCIYVTASGCSIHERRPQQCREMDCRLIASRVTYTQARKIKHFPILVWRKGRELLKDDYQKD